MTAVAPDPDESKPKRNEFLSNLIVAVITCVLTGIITYAVSAKLDREKEQRLLEQKDTELQEAKRQIHERYQKGYEAAVEKYAVSLGDLIGKAQGAIDDKLPPERIEISARAFVGARNELQETLTSLSASLDHEVDDLEKALGQLKQNPEDKNAQDTVRKDVLVIAAKWPVKSDAIKVQIRKMLAELGLEHLIQEP